MCQSRAEVRVRLVSGRGGDAQPTTPFERIRMHMLRLVVGTNSTHEHLSAATILLRVATWLRVPSQTFAGNHDAPASR